MLFFFQSLCSGKSKTRYAGSPPSFNHKEKFSVITMGTNCPIPNLERASASTMIQYIGKYFVVDTGNDSGDALEINP